jgi:peptidyl-prolyl cis-trans isomerase C
MNPFTNFRLGRIAALLAGAIALGGVAAATAQEAAPAEPSAATEPAGDPAANIVARVNGEEITEADLQLAAQDFRDTLAQLPPEERLLALVNGLIDIRLMARAAEAANVTEDPEAKRRVDFMNDRALRAEYLKLKVFDAVTDEAVQTLYDAEVAAFVPQEEMRASHILVATEEEAKAIIAELDGGADFAAIAKEKSLDLGSGANGGDLDYFTADRMVAPFSEAAFALEVGKYTAAPVQSDYGWHIILATDKRMSSAPTLEQRESALREQVAKDLFVAEVEKLRAGAEIEIVAPEPPAAPDAAAPAEEPATEPAPQ